MSIKQKSIGIFLGVLLMVGSLFCITLTSCERGDRRDDGVVVIRIAHNWPREMDTSFRDPITGEPAIGQQELNARLYAERRVLEIYNARIQWIPYPSNLTEDILRSVLAGDPLAELVRIVGGAQGQLLAQNVLQPLDEFAHIFDDEDSSWMFMGKAHGNHYFINNVLRAGNNAPLAFNIGMLERIPALRENGRTVLPVDLWLEGRWTWSAFEDYLQIVHDFWTQDWDGRIAFGANPAVASMMAIHSNGGAIYGHDGLGINSPETLEAIAFIERLIARNLIRSHDIIPGTGQINGLMDAWRFQWGHSVFANLPQWLAVNMVDQFNSRGETMGIVPFPRPDHMEAGDPRYRQVNDAWDAYAIPRGVSREMAELALRAFREYTVSFYRRMANSDRALDFLQADGPAMDSAMRMFIDITNENHGEQLFAAWRYLSSGENIIVNEFARNVGIWYLWSEEILGEALFRVQGASQYAVHVAARMGRVNELMDTIARPLRGTAIVNNIPPRFADVEGASFVFAAGTLPQDIDWSQFLTAEDIADGYIDFSRVSVDTSAANFAIPGKFENGVSFTVTDNSGNVGSTTRTVFVFNAENRTPPNLVFRSEFRTIGLNESTQDINWRNDFIESATDIDGLDIRDSLSVNFSEIDTTRAGVYNVSFTVTDFAGNTSSASIAIIVE